jgi:hypothetical protein
MTMCVFRTLLEQWKRYPGTKTNGKKTNEMLGVEDSAKREHF